MPKESKPQSRSPTPINLNIHATVIEVTVTLTVDLPVIPDINLVLTRAHILVLDTMINLTMINHNYSSYVIDLDMTDNITNPPQIIFFFFTSIS